MDGSGVILRDGAVVDNSDNGRNEEDSDLLAISRIRTRTSKITSISNKTNVEFGSLSTGGATNY